MSPKHQDSCGSISVGKSSNVNDYIHFVSYMCLIFIFHFLTPVTFTISFEVIAFAINTDPVPWLMQKRFPVLIIGPTVSAA